MTLVKRESASSLDMDDGDVHMMLPFDAPPTPPQPPEPPEPRRNMRTLLEYDQAEFASRSAEFNFVLPASQFLYIEKKPSRLYQYRAEPSPGDLKRIASGRLRVICLTANGLVEYQKDGTTLPVEDYRCQSESLPRSRRSSTTTATRRRAAKSATPQDSVSAERISPLLASDASDSSDGIPSSPEASH